MTGRAAGFCSGFESPGYANPFGGRGMGQGGRFCGQGRRNQASFPGMGRRGMETQAWNVPGFGQAPAGFSQPTPEHEAQALKMQADYLEKSLGDIRHRLEELEKD
jgi:hypothetical protein